MQLDITDITILVSIPIDLQNVLLSFADVILIYWTI